MLKLPRPGDVEGRWAEVGVLRLRDGHAASVQGEAVTQRVTDEKAIAIARQHPETLPSLFAWRTDDEEDLSKHHFTAQDLAADLLDARAEIASLRAKRGKGKR